MKSKIRLVPLFLPTALLSLGLLYGCNATGCKREEETVPPVKSEKKPEPPPPPASTPTEVAVDPPDAGEAADAGDADADADAKPTGVNPIAACCNALSGNMASAPPEQKLMYAAAVAVCNGARSNPNAAAALAQVRAALRSANVPASCR